jgi:uncharacterized membrane protein YczE
MATIVIGNLIVFLVICGVVMYKGLDLKKRSNWWYGLYAFISGFVIGLVRSDGNGGYHAVTNLTASFQAGTVFFIILVGSVMTHWQKTKAEKYLARSEEEYQEKLDILAESLIKDKSKRN